MKPKIKIEEHGAQALIDGDHGFGQVIGDRAMDLAIEKASKTGVGFVGAKNTSDYGMAAYYSLKAVGSDMIGITFCFSKQRRQIHSIYHVVDDVCLVILRHKFGYLTTWTFWTA